MEYQLESETALIEAILFLEHEPIDEQRIAKISGLSTDVIDQSLSKLRELLNSPHSGLELAKISDGWIIHPKKELWEYLREHYGKKNDLRLSKAALETLSIIAYSQPITRGEIEAIRGVQADNMIRLLVDRGLVHECGKKDSLGHPSQYGTTKEFLSFFRLGSIAELPRLDDLEEERFELDN